jgi:hypothetical protein
MLEEFVKFIARDILEEAFCGLFRRAVTPKIFWFKVAAWLCLLTSITAFVVSGWLQNPQLFETIIIGGLLGIFGGAAPRVCRIRPACVATTDKTTRFVGDDDCFV